MESNVWKVLSTSNLYTSYNLATQAAAQLPAPQTVILTADTTQDEDVNILLPGVFIDGSGFALTMTTDNTMPGFSDNGVPYAGKINNLLIVKDATTNINPVISLTSGLLAIDFDGSSVTTNGVSTYGVVCAGGNISNLNASAGAVAVYIEGGSLDNVTATFTEDSGFAIRAKDTALTSCHVADNGIISSALISLLGGCTAINCDATATAVTGQCYASEGVNYFNTCNGSATEYTGIGNNIFQGSGSEFLSNCTATSINGCCFSNCGQIDSNSSGTSTNSIVAYNCPVVNDSTLIGGGTLAAIDADGIALTYNNVVITNTTDYPTANAIYLQADGSSFENCTISVANASASCITGNAAYTAHFEDAGNTFIGSDNPVTNIVNV